MLDANSIALFSLFHHNISFQDQCASFDSEELYQNVQHPGINSIEHLANSIYNILTSSIGSLSDSQISLTLTGGMDSRVLLACLLKAGINPNCLTYGNPGAKDIFFARRLAKEFGLNFHNAAKHPPSKDWYYKWVVETIKRDKGNSHLHRAHRTAAIAEHVEKYSPKVLFTGHMGGEGLRGLSYNSYFASPFFEWVNERRKDPIEAARAVLDQYFLRSNKIDFPKLVEQIARLSWMRHDREINKLFFLYDLVAKIHHAQDIRIYNTYLPNTVPAYLQKEYLDVLFASTHHFLAKRRGALGRLSNPYVHCKLIESLYPKLLDYPLANGYKPREYMTGFWYYIPAKTFRDLRNRRQFPPSFSYGKWYLDFVKEHSQSISPKIWEIYSRENYMKALKNNSHCKDEGYWHKFSNPIFFDLVEKYKKGIAL